LYKRQNYIKRILPFLDKPLIKVISGMRRSGKSTILQHLIEELLEHGAAPEQILYINMESLDNVHFRDIAVLHRTVKERKTALRGKPSLLIDEVQEIPDWERAVNSFLADDDADIIITGSNSKLLSGEFSDLLTGRYIEIPVFPLVFSEFINIRSGKSEEQHLFDEFLRFGGMPGIHHLDFQPSWIYQYLASIRDSVVFKDVVKRYKIRDVALLEKIMLFVFDNIGNILSARKIADFFKKERRSLGHETVYNYLHYLEEACIINKVPRYDLKGKRLLEVSEKYYLTDIGLSHAFGGYKDRSISAYLENIVFIELRYRGYEVYIGKVDDYEIDFVARCGNETMYIQVCYLLSDETVRERELRPFHLLRDNYPKLLLTMDKLPEGNEGGIIRRYLPEWLLDKE
jgi:uncharacterized protein